MSRSGLAVALLLSSVACAVRPHTFEGEPWFEVRSEHFIVHASTAEKEAVEAARSLERIRAGLLAASWHGAVLPSQPTTLDLFEDESAMRELYPAGLQGIAANDPFGDELLIANAEEPIAETPMVMRPLAMRFGRGLGPGSA